MADTSALRNEVAAVFDAVRGGDTSRVGKLVAHGNSVVPAVAPLLQDANATVRLEAIALLDALGSKQAAQAAVRALGDSEADIRSRAARLLFRAVMRDGPGDFPDLGSALGAAPADRPHDAARLLLLAFVPDGEASLRSAAKDGGLVKLSDDGPAVDAALPADMALSRRGAADARTRLLSRIQAGTAADLEFLLRAVGMIDAPNVLHELARRTLGDERGIGGGVPSGVGSPRRLTDLAVEAFMARLNLATGIETAPTKRYSPADTDKVRKAVSTSMPQ